ncbi:hypothetical protein GCM10012275_25980 [Longimycelium tulufanense]|uniref:Hydrolase n=1 Tax=Longimycelium tulufanense TaxID=907463 RepID=A0A8J3CEG9_9PSEU|nr:alpha/beta hydrolase [Longimycelium tulufanense]GGM53715.1 hypothetical protein GCM10012275_25980 [Longimycelium tulufanense]
MGGKHVLLIHGFTGSGPAHWQRWLAGQFAGQAGVTVDFPTLPEPDRPVVGEWLRVLRERLAAADPAAELIVLTHSCGSTLWLHHAATVNGRARRADRVLLVSPPSLGWRHPDVRGFQPAPLEARGLRRAAGVTRMVVGSDDPHCTLVESRAVAARLGVELDVVPDGQHLNTDAGFGPWPAVLGWVVDPRVRLTSRMSLSHR